MGTSINSFSLKQDLKEDKQSLPSLMHSLQFT